MTNKAIVKIEKVGKGEGFNLEESLRLVELLDDYAMGCGNSDCALLTKLQECFDAASAELEE